MREGHDVGEYCPWTYALGFLGLDRCRNILAANARNGTPGQGQGGPPANNRVLTLGVLADYDLCLIPVQRLVEGCVFRLSTRDE